MRFFWVIALLFVASGSQAFNFQNHSIICQMAYEQLSAPAQQKVDVLIAKSPFKSFAEACPWPDKIRSQAIYKHTKTWHYINVPRDTQQVKMEHCDAKGCVVSAIALKQQKLKKNTANDWQSLLFLSHFVGDLHQPLHVSFADDWGGNGTTITVGKNKTNMHSYWDGALLKRQPWRQYSAQLLASITDEQKQLWRQGDLTDWATESLRITHDAYRLLPPSNKINDKYRDYFIPKLELQMQKASVRLAKMLNDL